jgi:hypothetical protein
VWQGRDVTRVVAALHHERTTMNTRQPTFPTQRNLGWHRRQPPEPD